jgi:hypothetical protein
MTDTGFDPYRPLDVLAIEAEARRLRAEAAAALVRAAIGWIAARLGRRPVGAARAA